ncbi:MAG: protein kinase domain-containing protein [Gemmatimonadaceae bacterium]
MPDSLERLRAALEDRYDVEREIGRGATATVYAALDRKLDRRVAIKVLHPELSAAVGADRFTREIRLLARLQHPHIVALFDSGTAGGSLYYVMPDVEGETLRERLTREGRLPTADALRITREVADALDYAHAHGLVHRDIKPENILLSAEHACVADFGIARALAAAIGGGGGGGGGRITATGLVVGTPAYMSPEQASGDDDAVDGRSDVYSLACVLYEMVVGEAAFSGHSARSVLARRFGGIGPAIRRSQPRVAPAIAAVLERGMAFSPSDRFTTAGDLAAALPVLSADGAVARSFGRRRVTWAGLAAAGIAAAAMVLLAPAGARPTLDASLYTVSPFVHRNAVAPEFLDGDGCALLLYNAFQRWEGVRLVDGMRVHDARARLGEADNVGLPGQLEIAAGFGAGRLVAGELWRMGDTIFVRAALYDVGRDGDVIREHTVRIGVDMRDANARFQELADSLLIGGSQPVLARDGAMGTRSLAAWRSYADGHAALQDWRLGAAEDAFRGAADVDPGYAEAQLWLAQTMLWSGSSNDPSWRGVAESALRHGRGRLSSGDLLLAQGLSAMASGDYPEACRRFNEMIARDSLDFAAWYGLGECHSRDAIVLRDDRSPSGWRFRASYAAAIDAYRHALAIIPSVHRAFRGVGFARLQDMLWTEPTTLRLGLSAPPDTLRFGAFASLDSDTLVLVPYPFHMIVGGGGQSPTAGTATDRNRALLLQITTSWVRAFEMSADAHEALGRALEAVGSLKGPGSALDAVGRARALTVAPVQRLRLAIAETRLRLRLGEFIAARSLADSILAAHPDPNEADSYVLAPLAALVGRASLSARLVRRSAELDTFYTPEGRPLRAPRAVLEPTRALLVFAALGAPVDSMIALSAEVQKSIRAYFEWSQWTQRRDELLTVPLTLAFPVLGDLPPALGGSGADHILRMQRALLDRDFAGVRELHVDVQRRRDGRRAGDVSIDGTFLEASLLTAIGDTAAAIDLLDRSLEALPTLGPSLLERVEQAGCLVRAMVLRAELAAANRDTVIARRWALPVVELWSGADPALVPVVQRMRVLAATPRQ